MSILREIDTSRLVETCPFPKSLPDSVLACKGAVQQSAVQSLQFRANPVNCKSLQLLSNLFRSLQVPSDPFKSIPNPVDCKSLQILSNPFKSLQIPSDPFKSFQILSIANPLNSFQIPSYPFRSIHIPSNPFDCKSLQIFSNPFKSLQIR